MNKPNIIWIVVDSVRNYSSNDKHGKIKIMQSFAYEGVEFTNAVSSAASTLMSTSSMFASRQANYISRDFATYEYNRVMFPPLTDVLKSNGYNTYTIHHYIYLRKRISHILHCIPPTDWPKRITKHREWNDDEMNSIFFKLIKKGLREPFFLHMHYNVVTGNKFTSRRVGAVLRKLKEEKLYDNSIIILSSDHGYPDPNRTKFTWKQKTLEGHDLFITDDNIMIPLIIKYPGCPKNKKITDVVSSLDIATTILSLLKIPYDKYKFEGLNLLNYIKGEKTPHRKVRTDTRYYFQPNKITSLRGNKFKYTYNFEKKPGSNEGFFDIENDRLEQNNLINSKNLQVTTKLDEFRREFKLSEKKGIELQNNYLGGKFEKLLEDTGIDNIERVLVFGTANVLFVNILLNKITKLLKNAKVDVIIKKKLAKEVNIESDKLSFIVSNLTCRDLRSRLKRLRKNKYNLVIIPLTDPLCVGYNSIFKIANKLEADKIMKVDYNMGLVKESNMWTAILKDFKKNLITDLYNPRPFASKLTVLMKRIIFKKDF